MFQIVITPRTKAEAQQVASLTQMLADTFSSTGEVIEVAGQKTIAAKAKKVEKEDDDEDEEEDEKPVAKKGPGRPPKAKKPVEEDEDEEEEEDDEEEEKPAKKGKAALSVKKSKKVEEDEDEEEDDDEDEAPKKSSKTVKSKITIDEIRKGFHKAKTANERKAKKLLEKYKVTSLVNLDPKEYEAFAAELKKIG